MRSLANYLLHGSNNTQPNRGTLLATNFAGSDVRSWSREFAEFRKLKPNLSRAVTHISLNLSPGDRQVSDEEFVEIAKQFRAGLGYTDDCPFLLVRHADRAHQHVHLMLSRISLSGVVPETNDFRKAEKLAVALRKEFRLKGPADKKKNDNEETEMKTTRTDDEKRNAAIIARFEEATADADAKHATDAEPDAPSIEPVGMTNVKQDRDMRREIQTEQYQNALLDIFREDYRFHRVTQKAVTLYFKDKSRLYDSGNRVQVFESPNPAVAAARLMDVVALKGWDSGFVVRGSDELLRQAAIIAIRRGLQIVALDAHQMAIIAAVREAEGAASSVVAAPSPSLSLRQPNRLSLMTGKGGIGQRLGSRRNENEQEGIDSGKNRPAGPRGPRF